MIACRTPGVVKVPFPDHDLDGPEACENHAPPTRSIRESFAREIHLLATIDHPGVVKMLGASLPLPYTCPQSYPYPTLP